MSDVTEAVPSDAVPTDAVPTDAVPTDAVPTDAVSTDAVAASESSAAAESEVARSKNRKVREGIVVSAKMDKTAVVAVTRRSRHPQYKKTVQQTKKYFAHDEENDLSEGDRVRIIETRPLSSKKRWRLLEVVERAR